MEIDPAKYITFKRSDLIQLFGELALPPWTDDDGEVLGGNIDCAPLAETILRRVADIELADAIVIRKRDKLASGALHSYATACWTAADVLIEVGRNKEAEELTVIGDFFNQQYQEARELQDHFPTL